jgi:hypothetical protein
VSTAQGSTSPPAESPGESRGDRRIWLAAIVAVIVFAAVGAAVWFAHSSGSSSSTSSSPSPPTRATPAVAAEIVSPARLREIATASGRLLYWAGPRRGTRIEYTRTRDGSTYVRYLTGSARAGAPGARYVVVATYVQPDAYQRVSTTARKQHLFVANLPGGAIAVTRAGHPENINVVYPKLPYQIEVYTPTAAETRQLVFAGAIKQVR